MIINNKLCELTDKYKVNDKNMKLLKVKLLILNKNIINLSFMFYECASLKEFHLISEKEKILNQGNKDENIEKQS